MCIRDRSTLRFYLLRKEKGHSWPDLVNEITVPAVNYSSITNKLSPEQCQVNISVLMMQHIRPARCNFSCSLFSNVSVKDRKKYKFSYNVTITDTVVIYTHKLYIMKMIQKQLQTKLTICSINHAKINYLIVMVNSNYQNRNTPLTTTSLITDTCIYKVTALSLIHI